MAAPWPESGAPLGARGQTAATTSTYLSDDDRRALAQYRAELQRVMNAEAPSSAASNGPGPPPRGNCKLYSPDVHRLTAQECQSCHPFHRSHPVDFEYESRAYRPGADLRPLSEVVKRGVFMPDGMVRCVSCHDARSRWAGKLALPPGAALRPAVDTRNPATYERPVPKVIDGRGLADGTAVSPTPLCKVCHTTGD
jgi:hypothetical protein